MAKVLCIDDDVLSRLVIADFLMDMGHEVLQAATGAEGIAQFHRYRPDIVFSDLRMPGGDGFLVIAHLAEEAPDTPVVIISGTATVEEAAKALRLGAWDYLAKPVTDMIFLGYILDRMLARARDRREERQHLSYLQRRNLELECELRDGTSSNRNIIRQLEEALKMSISSLNLALREKDPYTAGHNERVASIAVDIGAAMGMGMQGQETLMLGGLLHDIGKIGVPQRILNKRGSLTPGEVEQVKSHVEGGHRILHGIPFNGPVALAVLQHHERYDGSGYPNGLSGESILLEARILAVADVFEALTSDRPYRAGLGAEDAAKYISDNAGTHFCPNCVGAFRQVIAHQQTEQGE